MTDLRRTAVDLYELAEEHRSDAADAREEKERVENTARDIISDPEEDAKSVAGLPDDLRQEFEQCKARIEQHLTSAESLEHYADQWSDGDACEFTLEELNGDEYAAVMDTASANAQADGSIPQGLGGIKSLEFGVVDIPDPVEADPGEWPAVVVNDLFQELNDITTPEGVDLGNESLRQAVEGNGESVPEVDPVQLDETDMTVSQSTDPAEE